MLKDIQHEGAYSNLLNTDNRYDNSDFPESRLEYGKQATIETLSFEKEVYLQAAYSFMPVTFGGTAVNKLNIGNANFTFKTKAIKGAGFNTEPLHTYFYLFEVPTKFKSERTLSFMYYKYPTNWNTDENAGVYVIKKKRE